MLNCKDTKALAQLCKCRMMSTTRNHLTSDDFFRETYCGGQQGGIGCTRRLLNRGISWARRAISPRIPRHPDRRLTDPPGTPTCGWSRIELCGTGSVSDAFEYGMVRVEVEMAGQQAYIEDVARAVEAKLGTTPVVTPSGRIRSTQLQRQLRRQKGGKRYNEIDRPRLLA